MGFDPRFGNDPMWNTARTTNLVKQQLDSERKPQVPQKEKRTAYVMMIILFAMLAGVILLFILL
ncbi:MAG: hypothetical protein K2K56_00005 [Lachnospiraceae bacterium]|nr:hypothetical protein [Lachnospiraceae bacterium]